MIITTLVVALFVLYGIILWRYRRQGDLVTGSLITALIICLIEDVMGQQAYILLIRNWWTPSWISLPICLLFMASILYDLETKRRLKKQLNIRDRVKKEWGYQIVNPKQSKGGTDL